MYVMIIMLYYVIHIPSIYIDIACNINITRPYYRMLYEN